MDEIEAQVGEQSALEAVVLNEGAHAEPRRERPDQPQPGQVSLEAASGQSHRLAPVLEARPKV